MTNFSSLFKKEQKIIFDLGNLVNDVYTAAFNVTLTASYFTAPAEVRPADLILPISSHSASQNMASVFAVPPMQATDRLQLPQSERKAVFTIAATGQLGEEFWWSNVLQSDIETFPRYGFLYGFSPFREVQLYIDSNLAGVVWPFPIIFTGGVAPGLWRPIVGIDAFDLKENEIDITPWLPVLCDGQPHSFSIRVSGLNDTNKNTATLSDVTGDYWLITGKIFLWLGVEGEVTTGTSPASRQSDPDISVSSNIEKSLNGTNDTLLYDVQVRRHFSSYSTIQTSSGTERVSWTQSLAYWNAGNVTDNGNIQTNSLRTQGFDLSSSGYMKRYDYPLCANQVFSSMRDNITIVASVERSKSLITIGEAVFPTGLEAFVARKGLHETLPSFAGAWLRTTQNGSATYLANNTESTSFSFGHTEQEMSFGGIRRLSFREEELFHRYVEAVNSTVVRDQEILLHAPDDHVHAPSDARSQRDQEDLLPAESRRSEGS